jgi:Leucine-rich repeat (LRR) protein
LYCNNNHLTSLSLPESLIQLYCQDNQLTTLPYLPDSLQYVRCTTQFSYTFTMDPARLQAYREL